MKNKDVDRILEENSIDGSLNHAKLMGAILNGCFGPIDKLEITYVGSAFYLKIPSNTQAAPNNNDAPGDPEDECYDIIMAHPGDEGWLSLLADFKEAQWLAKEKLQEEQKFHPKSFPPRPPFICDECQKTFEWKETFPDVHIFDDHSCLCYDCIMKKPEYND
jgi:hypothetical protein